MIRFYQLCVPTAVTVLFAGTNINHTRSIVRFYADAQTIPAGSAFSLDFSRIPVGTIITEKDVLQLWAKSDSVRTMGRVKVVQGGSGNLPHHIIQVMYPKGGVGPKECGALFVSHIAPADEYFLSYRIRFSEDFDFGKGGKIHGMASGGGKYSGGVIPKSGDGWSARLVWERNGAISAYVYHFGMKGPWGDTWHLKGRFQPGKWHGLVERVKLNTGSNSDGVLQIWLDGKLALSRTNVCFRTNGKGRIDSFLFSTFYGGHTPDFAPSRDGLIWFDDFQITTELLGTLEEARPFGVNGINKITAVASKSNP